MRDKCHHEKTAENTAVHTESHRYRHRHVGDDRDAYLVLAEISRLFLLYAVQVYRHESHERQRDTHVDVGVRRAYAQRFGERAYTDERRRRESVRSQRRRVAVHVFLSHVVEAGDYPLDKRLETGRHRFKSRKDHKTEN